MEWTSFVLLLNVASIPPRKAPSSLKDLLLHWPLSAPVISSEGSPESPEQPESLPEAAPSYILTSSVSGSQFLHMLTNAWCYLPFSL